MSAAPDIAPLSLDEAASRIVAGGLVAYPTETVWGLGADARQPAALARLGRWKGRGEDRPVSLLVEDAAALEALGAELTAAARRARAAFWPGPLTGVVRCRAGFAPGVARADGAVGFRCSPHPVARRLAQGVARCGAGPLTATSLNRSGAPPARSRAEAERACTDGPDAPVLLALGDAGGEAPSSVLDCSGDVPVVVREGALSAARLIAVLRQEPLR